MTSMPPNFERSQRPCTRLAWAWGMLRAWDTIRAMACSAADRALDPAALQTTMPRRVAAATSTLSTPVPARPTTLSRSARAISSAVTLVALRTTRAS